MLRIDLLNTAIVRMSGRMAEGCREEVESFLASELARPRITVDLSEVTYIDHDGEEALCWLGRRGAKFTADNPYALHICDRLHLRMAEPRIASHRLQDSRGSSK